MVFDEALKELCSGKYVSRSNWASSGSYLAVLKGIRYIWLICPSYEEEINNWTPLVSDLQADDWEIVKNN